jgi:hypothetical protein
MGDWEDDDWESAAPSSFKPVAAGPASAAAKPAVAGPAGSAAGPDASKFADEDAEEEAPEPTHHVIKSQVGGALGRCGGGSGVRWSREGQQLILA